MSPATIDRMVACGNFPAPIQIPAAPGCAIWTDKMIETWMEEQVALSKPRLKAVSGG